MTRFSFLKIARSVMFTALFAVVFSSCTIDEDGNVVWDAAAIPPPEKRVLDSSSKYYSSKNKIWVNDKVIDKLDASNSRVEVDLSEQKARIYKKGEGTDILVIETQISSGTGERPTPVGSYKILEKKPDKESNLYGKWVDLDTGKVLISDGDSREPPEGDGNYEFRGSPMPYWLRLTRGGVGMHIGYVPNYPASHGCIRMPKQIQPLVYSKVKAGTPVLVKN